MTTRSRLAAHTLSLPDSPPHDEGRAPEWIHLLPSGAFSGRDGRGPYRLTDPDAVIAATREWFRGADMPVDYNHQWDLQGKGLVYVLDEPEGKGKILVLVDYRTKIGREKILTNTVRTGKLIDNLEEFTNRGKYARVK